MGKQECIIMTDPEIDILERLPSTSIPNLCLSFDTPFTLLGIQLHNILKDACQDFTICFFIRKVLLQSENNFFQWKCKILNKKLVIVQPQPVIICFVQYGSTSSFSPFRLVGNHVLPVVQYFNCVNDGILYTHLKENYLITWGKLHIQH